MISLIPVVETQAGTCSRAQQVYGRLLGLFIVMFCTYTAGEALTEQGPPDIGRGKGTFGEQVVTANALRAPAKAQNAVQNAARAMAHNKPKEAEKQIAYALDLYPDYAKALVLHAIWKMPTEPSDSIKDLERAIHVDPAYGVPYAVLASIYNDSQRYDDAFPLIQRAMQLLPFGWPVHYEMARTLRGKNRIPEALREVTEAMRLMSADAAADSDSRAAVRYLHGLLLIDQHEFATARLEFELILKENPKGTAAERSTQILAQLDSHRAH